MFGLAFSLGFSVSIASLYAGWIVVDVRLLLVVLLLSTGLSLMALGLFVRGRRWHEYVTLFVSFFSVLLVLCLLVLQLLGYPVFIERHFFRID